MKQISKIKQNISFLYNYLFNKTNLLRTGSFLLVISIVFYYVFFVSTFTIFKTLLWVFSITGILISVTGKRFEKVCAVAIIIGVLFLYIFGFLNNIKLGYYLTWLFIFIFYLYAYILFIVDGQRLKDIWNNTFTFGSIMFGLLMIYIYFLNRKSGFIFYDELSHWAPMTKQTILHNAFYSIKESALPRHKDYPPFFSLLETLWCYLNGDIYAENTCLRGMNSFMYALFIPVLSIFDKKKVKDCIIGLLVTLCIIIAPITVYSINNIGNGFHIYNTIYADWNEALIVAFIFFTTWFYKEDKFKLFVLVVSLTALLLTKQTGIALYMLCVANYFFTYLFLLKTKKEFNYNRLFLVGIPIVFYLAWKIEINILGASYTAQFSLSQIGLSGFFKIVSGTSGEPWQHEAFINFINAIKSSIILARPFKQTFFASSIMISFFLFILSLVASKKQEGLVLSIFYFLGSIAYALMMMLLYMFSFGSYEGPTLASFERYMGSYLYIGICLVLMVVIIVVNDIKNNKLSIAGMLIVVIVLIMSCNISDFKNLIPNSRYTSLLENDGYKRTKYVVENICNNKSVLIIESYNEGIYTDYLLKYDTYGNDPHHCSVYNIHRWDAVDYSNEEWLDHVKKYDYIYLLFPDDDFLDKYWYSNTEQDVFKYGVYNINIINNKIELTFVGSYENWSY